MSVSERKKKILGALIEEYIKTAEPVGSKAIAGIANLSCSSATIRSEAGSPTVFTIFVAAAAPLPS